MLAGAWILVLLPLMDVLTAFGWASSIPVPTIFDYRGVVRALDDTLLCYGAVYEQVVFCMGLVLLFSKERGRRVNRLDWTRRWGVVCSYVVLLLSAAGLFFLAALVLAGIAAVFHSMPLRYEPEVTRLLVGASTAYLWYGAHPMNAAGVVQVAFSSIAMVLACVALFDALRSSGSKWMAAILLAPLALFSLIHLAKAGLYSLGISGVAATDVYSLGIYFRPQLMARHVAGLPTSLFVSGSIFSVPVEEAIKWCSVLAIAVWLSMAQLAAWWPRKKAGG
jgi:hypothetical protein